MRAGIHCTDIGARQIILVVGAAGGPVSSCGVQIDGLPGKRKNISPRVANRFWCAVIDDKFDTQKNGLRGKPCITKE
jgi:hypothetical protein